jgi:hypothetical protein
MKIVDIDYKKNHDSYARAWYDKVKETIATRLLEDTSIRLMDYEKLVSPQFYNYSTDEVQISIEYDYDRMIQYLRDNEETFSQYILEKNTSYE